MPNIATKKLGPLPVWAWGLTALAFIGLVWYLRRSAGDEVTVTEGDTDYGQQPIAPPGPEPGDGVIDIPLPEIPWPELPPPSLPSPGWPYDPLPPEPIYEDPREPVLTQPPPDSGPSQPEPTPPPPPPKQTEFRWGGKTWRKGDLAAFRKHLKNLPKSSIYSGPNGYRTWATNHPKVVKDFGWPKS